MNYPTFFDNILVKKRQQLIESGVEPYPYSFEVRQTIHELLKDSASLMDTDAEVSVYGRAIAIRKAGKALFLDLKKDASTIQCYLNEKKVSERVWELMSKLLDLGDIIKVTGKLFHTHTGELTIDVKSANVLCKVLVRIPYGKATDEKSYYKGENPELQYRERYLYWNISPDGKALIERRFQIIRLIREWMQKEGFLEVQTPTLEMVYGGAEARPFVTNIWALDCQRAYLRISPELYLKRYIAGGFEKVYTICQNFRNEGVDKSHNPEFTMMEWYEVGTDYHDQMQRFEKLTEFLALSMFGSTQTIYQGHVIDFKAPWRRLSVIEALREYASMAVTEMSDGELKVACHESGIELPESPVRGVMIAMLFEVLCEHHLIQPTFVIDHPVEISPLTKEKRGQSGFVERFEPFVNGMEIGNAYSEMTDPLLQYLRFVEQKEQAADTPEEGFDNHPLDLDFIKAIGVGMPPTGGVGYGIDRVIMLLTNSESIRDVIPFPMMKPSKENWGKLSML